VLQLRAPQAIGHRLVLQPPAEALVAAEPDSVLDRDLAPAGIPIRHPDRRNTAVLRVGNALLAQERLRKMLRRGEGCQCAAGGWLRGCGVCAGGVANTFFRARMTGPVEWSGIPQAKLAQPRNRRLEEVAGLQV